MRRVAIAAGMAALTLAMPAQSFAAVTGTFATNPCAPLSVKVAGKSVKFTVCTLLSKPTPSSGRFTQTAASDGSLHTSDTKTSIETVMYQWAFGYTDNFGVPVTGGTEYLWVDVGEVDHGTKTYLSDYDNFGLVDSTGRIYAAGAGEPPHNAEPIMPVENLSQGIQNRGWMEFTVPVGSTNGTGPGRYSLVWNEGGAIGWSTITNLLGS